MSKTNPVETYRLICILDSIKDGQKIISNIDASPDYLHIHILKSAQLDPIDFITQSNLSQENSSQAESENTLYQWGTPLKKDAHTRSAIVSAEEIKKYGQVGIGSAARGESEIKDDFIGGGEAFLSGSKNVRITKGDGVFEVEDNEKYWTFQVADFANAQKISITEDSVINGREALMNFLKEKSGGKPFVATFDAQFEQGFFARSNGIFPEDQGKGDLQNPDQSVFFENINGGHLLGGSRNDGDIASLGKKADSVNFALKIVSKVLLKPIDQLKIATKDGQFREPRTEAEVNEAASKIQKAWRKLDKRKTYQTKIVIIGGGIAGCTTALEMAKKGYDVTIIEKGEDVLRGTSARTPGRMGLGYHYFNPETSFGYMENTIGFMKKYSDCFVDEQGNSNLSKGRYFIVKDSSPDAETVMKHYARIKDEFKKRWDNDPKMKEIFTSDELHQDLDKTQYEQDVDLAKVECAIETQERLLDWQKFEGKLKEEIAKYQNIKIERNFEVEDINIDPSAKEGKFSLSSKNQIEEIQDQVKEVKADYVINCTWQNIEKLNENAGIVKDKAEQKGVMTSRLKLLVEVELPESLKDKHSMFFCFGPHAMFSNLGNGIGRITYAPVTNYATRVGNEYKLIENGKEVTAVEEAVGENYERWMSDGLSEQENKEYGQAIINGVAEYIPEMKDATLVRVIPGIVKSKGLVDLKDTKSEVHRRNYSGVEEQQFGWVDNAAMKLFYGLNNAKEVAEIISKQEVMGDMANAIIMNPEFVKGKFTFSISEPQNRLPENKWEPGLYHFFTDYLQENFTAEAIKGSESRGVVKDIKSKIGTNRDVSSIKKALNEGEIGDYFSRVTTMESIEENNNYQSGDKNNLEVIQNLASRGKESTSERSSRRFIGILNLASSARSLKNRFSGMFKPIAITKTDESTETDSGEYRKKRASPQSESDFNPNKRNTPTEEAKTTIMESNKKRASPKSDFNPNKKHIIVEDCKTDSEIKTTESNVAISDESLVDIASAFEIYNIISADSLRTNTSSHLLRRQSLKKLQANVVTEDSAITNFVTEDSAIVTEDSVTTTTELEEAPQEKVAPLSYGNFSNLQKSPNQK